MGRACTCWSTACSTAAMFSPSLNTGRTIESLGTATELILSLTACVQRLLAEHQPGQGQAQIKANQHRMLGQPALGGVGKEAIDKLFGLKAGQLGGLYQAALGQRDFVVDEVPVASADQP